MRSLLASILLIPLLTSAQFYRLGDPPIGYKTDLIYEFSDTNVFILQADTVRCVLLLCDTSTTKVSIIKIGDVPIAYDTIVYNKTYSSVYWAFGYVIRSTGLPDYKECGFLDADRRRLQKNLFVLTYSLIQ